MSKLLREDVLKLAKLCKLNLTDSEVEHLQNELGDILDYVKRLDDIDTNGLEPTYQVSGKINSFRDDIVVENQIVNPTDLMKILPEQKDGYIKVPRMI